MNERRVIYTQEETFVRMECHNSVQIFFFFYKAMTTSKKGLRFFFTLLLFHLCVFHQCLDTKAKLI